MLPERLANDPRAVARASHAVRSQTSDDNWLEIDSTLVDEITSRPLPSPNAQLATLISILKARVGDAPFNPISIQDEDALVGAVGAVDRASLRHLLEWASKEGHVTLSENRSVIALTPKAWGTDVSAVVAPVKVKDRAIPSGICKGHCPQCGPDRSADIVASYEKRWDDEETHVWTVNSYRILRCRGCETVYIQHEHLFSEDEDYYQDPLTGEHYPVIRLRITYWPSPAKRVRPQWLGELNDTTLRDLLDEVYGALDSDHRVLAAIGTRTALDRAMVLKGADEASGFGEKLAELKRRGVISEHEQQLLTTLTDAGSAAAHRGWKPNPELLTTLVDGVEAFLHRTLVLGTAVDAIKNDVPARPRRSKKS